VPPRAGLGAQNATVTSLTRARIVGALLVVQDARLDEMVEYSDDSKMKVRAEMAEEFYAAIGLDHDLRPWFVSDEASLYDVQLNDDADIVEAVKRHYGVELTIPDDFRAPFWRLLDRLAHDRL
jgi:hypothetical protein